MTNINEIFGRIDDNGNVVVLHTEDGVAVTRIETEVVHVYPVDSTLSTNYEHPVWIILYQS
jgi:hypothetical protein